MLTKLVKQKHTNRIKKLKLEELLQQMQPVGAAVFSDYFVFGNVTFTEIHKNFALAASILLYLT